MRISEAVPLVLLEQTVFDDIETAVQARDHVLNTLITQKEYDDGAWVPGVAVLDGPDPDHPEFDEGYHAYLALIEWYRLPINLTEYLYNQMFDDLGGDEDWDAPFDGGQMEALNVGIEAGVKAGMVAAKQGIHPESKVTAQTWAKWLGDTDPAEAYDAMVATGAQA